MKRIEEPLMIIFMLSLAFGVYNVVKFDYINTIMNLLTAFVCYAGLTNTH